MSEGILEQTSVVPEQAPIAALDLKAERKFCSGMGMNFFIFFLVANGLQLIVSYLILFFTPEMMYDNYALYMILAMAPMYVIGVPVLWLLCKRREAVKLSQHKLGAGNYMIFLFMCFGVMIIGNIVGLIVNFVIGLIKGSPVVNSVDLMMNSSTLWANILIVGICAPIFEELMFRKFIVDRMVRYGEATAIVVSGLMFGLFHGNFSQFFYATALGMLFAFIYVKTGKLRYTILTHFIINMSSTLMVPVLQMIDTDKIDRLTGTLEHVTEMGMSAETTASVMARTMQGMTDMILPLIILIVYEMAMYGMAIAGIILLIVRRKRFICNPGQVTLPKGKRASVVWFNVGMILFTISCLVLFVYTILMV